jgi:hypothetical protein
MLSESFGSQSETQASLSVETSMTKLCFTLTGDNKHECFKRFCNYSNKKQISGHFSYVAPLKPRKLTNRFMYVFFDTE